MSIISKNIDKAVDLLNRDELVAIPTETVYGLAGNIFSEKAIQQIFKTKKRPFFNPLIVHIPNKEYLNNIVTQVPTKAKILAEHFWPGSMTLVLPKSDKIPDLITAGKDTVAVRVPNHSVTLELLNRLDFPLAAPSANPFNSISPTKPEHVENYFRNDIQIILDGGSCKKGLESTIIGFENDEPVIYRLGALALEAIEKIVGKVEVKNKKENKPDAPGMLSKHYAPKTKTILSNDIAAEIKKHPAKKIGIVSLKTSYKTNQHQTEILLSKKGDLTEASSKLYNAMHELDALYLDVIIIEKMPEKDLGVSMNDRLQRASS